MATIRRTPFVINQKGVSFVDEGHRYWIRVGIASLVAAVLLGGLLVPTATAGAQDNPEISDPPGDANPLSFAAQTEDDASLFQNLTAYDVLKAWIALETEDAFLVQIQVRDLPDGWTIPDSPPRYTPFNNSPAYDGTALLAHFSIAGRDYTAIAKVAMPAPGQMLVDYRVWRDDGASLPLSGGFDTEQDWVAFLFPKDAFVGLTDGSKLSQFWVLGRWGNFSMDYAPNAKSYAPGAAVPDPIQILEDGRLVAPQFGRDYTFGQYYRPPSATTTTGGWSSPAGTAAPNLYFAVNGPGELAMRPGDTRTFELLVRNDAAESDTVFFTLNAPAAGWSHHLSDVQAELAAGASKIVYVTVGSSSGATGSLESVASAASRLGASRQVFVVTRLDGAGSPGSPGGPGSNGDGFAGNKTGQEPDGESPGLILPLAAVGALVAAALWRTRRRA